MTKKRKSFVLHKDSLDILSDLDDIQAGKLFKAIHAYQNDEDIELDQITKMVFLPFKNQFKRDDEKYTETCERRAIAGSKGGKQKVANASNSKQKMANVADSVSKSKKDSKSDSDSKKEISNLSTATKPPKFSVDDFNCAEWFFSLLLQLNPKHKKPNIDLWADDVRKIINIDNRTYQEISDLMLWVSKDSFWQTNILSPKKLREKWDALTIQKNKVRHNKTEARTLNNLSVGEDFLNEH